MSLLTGNPSQRFHLVSSGWTLKKPSSSCPLSVRQSLLTPQCGRCSFGSLWHNSPPAPVRTRTLLSSHGQGLGFPRAVGGSFPGSPRTLSFRWAQRSMLMSLGFIKAKPCVHCGSTLASGRSSWGICLNYFWSFWRSFLVTNNSSAEEEAKDSGWAGGRLLTGLRGTLRGPFHLQKEARLSSCLPGVGWEGVWGIVSSTWSENESIA